MDESHSTPPTNGEQSNRSLDQSSSTRQPPNETSMRTGERTCTQKLSIPSLEKYDSTSANLWWQKFVQYVKMTKEIDISTMVNSKEILPQYREQLETIGQNALTEMTKTVREREPSSLPLHKLYTLFQFTLHTGTERTTQPIRFLRPEERKRRNGSRCMEKNSGNRKEL